MMARNVSATEKQRGTYQPETSEVFGELGGLEILPMHGGREQGG